jgi:predicted DCC family thiol-disulfide oxidoreductase YuxK
VTRRSEARIDLPGTVIYDGQCGFCRWCVALARRRLAAVPAFVPFQTADLPARGLTVEQARESVQFVPDGAVPRPVGGHRAVTAVLLAQPTAGWRLLGRAMATRPGSWVAARVYGWVSRHRGRLPGRCRSCGD